MAQVPSQAYDSADRPSTTSQVLRALLPFPLTVIVVLYAIIPIFYQGAGIFVSGCIWINEFTSYQCFTHNNIYIHRWALAPIETLTWADVTAVRSHCWAVKHGVAGGLTVFLNGNESVEVANANAVANAMRGMSYRYVVDGSVGPTTCPGYLYPLFAHWPG